MNRKTSLASLCCAIAAGILAPVLVHANPMVSMELTSVPGPVLGDVQTGPYTAQIGPAGLTSPSQFNSNDPTFSVICDDFVTDVSVGQIWQATVINMSALEGITSPLTTLKFGTTGTASDQQQAYMAAAWLADQLVSVDQSNAAGQERAGQLSFAIWGLFDPSSLSSLSGTDLNAALSDLDGALAQVQLAGYDRPSYYSNVSIYSPVPTDASQEFLSVRPVPEPGTLSLLAFGLAAIVWATRRRMRYSRAAS